MTTSAIRPESKRVVFINWRGPQGRETLDSVAACDFATDKEWRAEVSRLIGEYAMAGMTAYRSSRSCGKEAE